MDSHHPHDDRPIMIGVDDGVLVIIMVLAMTSDHIVIGVGDGIDRHHGADGGRAARGSHGEQMVVSIGMALDDMTTRAAAVEPPSQPEEWGLAITIMSIVMTPRGGRTVISPPEESGLVIPIVFITIILTAITRGPRQSNHHYIVTRGMGVGYYSRNCHHDP
mmetsp:Transcript_1353/g.3622  ORF Transcript_1353/g.3622 Transcript_1353/m.3622 type:complete len:162 (+) Transcript_1353:78-563(+)